MSECAINSCEHEGRWKISVGLARVEGALEQISADLMICDEHYNQIRGTAPLSVSLAVDL